ncbi:MAG: hydroxymethylbilane synthase, partial [Bacteroidetes bacterium]|nr:hydroxymethylbilane synthase [Bacteroidota bacterium]
AAGLERINLRPDNAINLDWMLPAPAQGAIMVVCKDGDVYSLEACQLFHDADTAICTKIERDFLRALMGGCSTPISALAVREGDAIAFRGNILSLDGKQKKEISRTIAINDAANAGTKAAEALLQDGGQEILNAIRNEK